MSQEVLAAQQWLNTTYGGTSGYIYVNETGVPGTATSLALVSALQIELGISPVTGNFGPLTIGGCDSNPLSLGSTGNRVRILQHGFYCKGYDPGTVTGTYSILTKGQVEQIQSDAGLDGSQISSAAYGIQMKAVLGVDEYVLLGGGNPVIQVIQQTMNNKYVSYIGLCPCDGIYSRSTATAMIYGLQAEEHMPTDVATGYFGDYTKVSCPVIPYSGQQVDYNGNTYSTTDIQNFTALAQYALYCMGRNATGSKYDPGNLLGTLDAQTIIALNLFQGDCALAVHSGIQLNDWMSLLLSTGNPNRAAAACDCVKRLTYRDAIELASTSDITTVGRYLTGDFISGDIRTQKNLLRPEMKAIFEANLDLFVIYQDPTEFYSNGGTDIADYFTYDQGYSDARKAFSAAKTLGVPQGTAITAAKIYFAVDYDFTEYEVYDKVVPYFEGINDYASATDAPSYRIGIYSARNTCTIVSSQGLSVGSFFADLSTGYSGNLGYPLPVDWDFDQIQETSDYVPFAIDRDIASGRYAGFYDFEDNGTIVDDWDLITQNGTAQVLFQNNGTTASSLPLYWSKNLNEDGMFALEDPILLSPLYTHQAILNHSFFSIRETNGNYVGVPGNNNADLRYVYTRGSDGQLLAGYADFSNTTLTTSTNPDFTLWPFYSCEVLRNADTGESTIQPVYPALGNFLATKALQYKLTYSVWMENEIPENTRVIIGQYAATGASFPHMVSSSQCKKPGDAAFGSYALGVPYVFLDLDFESGVLPEDRTLITDYVND
ncbi:MAG: DUF1906 domain-containing protein [Coriobacteriales bacterium]|nr:DUF1906 domain-containing protein [Coriobacteriales bacterium]